MYNQKFNIGEKVICNYGSNKGKTFIISDILENDYSLISTDQADSKYYSYNDNHLSSMKTAGGVIEEKEVNENVIINLIEWKLTDNSLLYEIDQTDSKQNNPISFGFFSSMSKAKERYKQLI